MNAGGATAPKRQLNMLLTGAVSSDRRLWLTNITRYAGRFTVKNLCKKYGIKTVRFNQKVTSVRENDKFKLLYDVNVHTRREIRHNRPDLVVFDKMNWEIVVIEIGVAWYTTLPKMEQLKFHKYATNSMVEDVMDLAKESQPDTNLAGELNNMYA